MLRRIDFRILPIILVLMVISLAVLSATTVQWGDGGHLLTPLVKAQIQWFALGWICFFCFSAIDYRKLRSWSWILYGAILLLLVGLFFSPAVQNVHRWYRLGPVAFQPSEYAKLVVVFALSVFLESQGKKARTWRSTLYALLIVFVPFVLILKQPDLGTALVLFPIALVMYYFGGVKRRVVAVMTGLALSGFALISALFLGILPHEELRPLATKVMKEYQYERLSPHSYHQTAAETAIALGGVKGSGWRKSEFTGRQWLPAAHTDSVFPAFAEEFGLVGVVFLLGVFFGLVTLSFQVAAVAPDLFGRFLAAGIAVYLAMHILVNLGMMCGFLPITGVPLVLISYGGSSILATMMALGILQSIYSRRFMF